MRTNPKQLRTLLILILLVCSLTAGAQEYRIQVRSKPLNELLQELHERYQLAFSYDDRGLSAYAVSLQQSFSSAESMLSTILEGFPLGYEKVGEVFMIFPVKQEAAPVKEFLLSGIILDKISGESLPYAHVLIDEQGHLADANGRFSARFTGDSVFLLQISYVGYYPLDTLVHQTGSLELYLQPSVIGLKEVVAIGKPVIRNTRMGEEAGSMRMNHKVATFLPGSGDNSVFNYLRLQPGILAAGEQSADLIIWGGYEGHSQVIFDGFTLFGLKNYNDNISAINPYFAKDILVLKGGYDATYGERVGGIVDITGISGNRYKPEGRFTINNMTMNGMGSLPLGENTSLSAAFRQTYYALYDPEELSPISRQKDNGSTGRGVDILVYPDYRFRDMNVKIAGRVRKDDPWFLSLYNGNDQYSYSLDQERPAITLQQEVKEENRQFGAGFSYAANWKQGNQSTLRFGYSRMENQNMLNQSVEGRQGNRNPLVRNTRLYNEVEEYHAGLIHRLILPSALPLEAGAGFYQNQIQFNQDSLAVSLNQEEGTSDRFYAYVQKRFAPVPSVELKTGLRMDYPQGIQKAFFQPRLALQWKPVESVSLNISGGLYHQFISKSSLLDDLGNYRFIWLICEGDQRPVLQSSHLVTGMVYQSASFTLSLEGFYKYTTGISRYLNAVPEDEFLYNGKGRTYGMDLYFQKRIQKHSFWISYSLSRTEEQFPYFDQAEYRLAPQDQRHEIKTALLLDFSPFHFVADYVFGSGLQGMSDAERYPYHRMDIAASWNVISRKIDLDIGISVLNVFNTENIKYSNLLRIPDTQEGSLSLHAEAVPFTPNLYLNLLF